jgi:hypothetical protein
MTYYLNFLINFNLISDLNFNNIIQFEYITNTYIYFFTFSSTVLLFLIKLLSIILLCITNIIVLNYINLPLFMGKKPTPQQIGTAIGIIAGGVSIVADGLAIADRLRGNGSGGGGSDKNNENDNDTEDEDDNKDKNTAKKEEGSDKASDNANTSGNTNKG